MTEFENKCKELTAICKESSDNLDAQIKQFEEEKRQRKLDGLKTYFDTHEKKFPDYADYEKVFNPKWGNATYKVEDAQEEIDAYINTVDVNVAYVRSLNDEFEAVMLDALKQGKTMSEVMGIALRLREQKEYKERKEREAEERARREAEIEARAIEQLKAQAEAEKQNIDSIESIYYMLVLRADQRIIFEKSYCVSSHFSKSSYKIFTHLSSFLRMRYRMVFS